MIPLCLLMLKNTPIPLISCLNRSTCICFVFCAPPPPGRPLWETLIYKLIVEQLETMYTLHLCNKDAFFVTTKSQNLKFTKCLLKWFKMVSKMVENGI